MSGSTGRDAGDSGECPTVLGVHGGGARSITVDAGSKEASIPSRHAPRTINFDELLVMCEHLCHDSTPVPFLGSLPVWFWMKHLSTTVSGGSDLTCSFKLSDDLVNRVRRAVSLEDHDSRQTGRTAGLENFSRRFTKEKASRMGRPNMIWAGDTLQSGSGVLRS